MSPSSVEKDNMLNKVKPVLRGHLLGNNKMALQDRWPLKRGSIHMKFSQNKKKCDLLMQVTV